MQSAMNRLSTFVRTRRKLVLGCWIGVLIVSLPFAAMQTKHLSGGGFEVPGSGSDAVDKAIHKFANQSDEPLGIVLEAQKGGNTQQALTAALGRIEKAKVDHASLDAAGKQQAAQQIAAGKNVVLFQLHVTGTRDDVLQAAKDLRDKIKIGKVTDGVQPYVVGQQALWAGSQVLQQEDLKKAENTGFPVILIVLLGVFGSVLAALLPVGLGITAVILTGAAIFLISLITTMSVFVTNVASLLGIGVAVDYSLFVLSRYRDEIHAGKTRDQALDTAMRTSGATVVFSGLTVIVSLAGLFLIDSTVIHSLAIGAIVVVAIAIMGAVSLLPALINLAGHRVEERGKIVNWVSAQYRKVRPKQGQARGRADLLGALVERRHAPPVGLRHRRGRDPADPRHPGAARCSSATVPWSSSPRRATRPARRRARAGHRRQGRDRADADHRDVQGLARPGQAGRLRRPAQADAGRRPGPGPAHIDRRHGRADHRDPVERPRERPGPGPDRPPARRGRPGLGPQTGGGHRHRRPDRPDA